MPAAEVQSITLKPGMQSGSKVFYDIELRTTAGRNISGGKSLPENKHAEWLVQRLSQVLGRNA